MGCFFGSIHLRTEDLAAVRTAVEAAARESQSRFLIAPPVRGWTVVFPHNNGQDWTVSEVLARHVPTDFLHCLIHDDDVFAYRLYRDGALADEYDSKPGYFDPDAPRDQAPQGGNVELLRPYLVKPGMLDELRVALTESRRPGDFEQDRLERFALLLGLPNACTSYEYLQAGERDGIKGWRKFIHIPDLSVQKAALKAAHKAAAAQLQAQLKRWTANKTLLVDAIAEPVPRGYLPRYPVCAVDAAANEVLHLWTELNAATPGSTLWTRYTAPDWTPQPTTLTASPKAHYAVFSRSGRWLVVQNSSGKWTVEILDHRAGTKHAEFSFPSHISSIEFAPDESRVYVLCESTLHCLPLHEGAQKVALPFNGVCRCVAIHPDGRWAALAYESMLGLLDLEQPSSMRLLGLGGLVDMSSIVSQFAESGAVQRMMDEMARLLPAAEVEKHRQAWLRQLQQTFQGREPVTLLRFSPDGRWLLCGIREGVRVFDWEKLKAGNAASPTPDFSADTDEQTADPDDEIRYRRKNLYALDFDPSTQRVLFGGLGGNVRYLDLASGLSGDLLVLQDGLSVQSLALTRDRTALVGVRMPVGQDKKERPRMQVWSYSRLCAEAGIPH